MSTPLMRVCAENGTKFRAERAQVALAQIEALLGEHDDAAPFRRFIGERGKLRGIRQFLLRHARAPAETRVPADCRA